MTVSRSTGCERRDGKASLPHTTDAAKLSSTVHRRAPSLGEDTPLRPSLYSFHSLLVVDKYFDLSVWSKILRVCFDRRVRDAINFLYSRP